VYWAAIASISSASLVSDGLAIDRSQQKKRVLVSISPISQLALCAAGDVKRRCQFDVHLGCFDPQYSTRVHAMLRRALALLTSNRHRNGAFEPKRIKTVSLTVLCLCYPSVPEKRNKRVKYHI
jgi:hypothetical protein